MAKLIERLTGLEKKLDAVIAQAKPFQSSEAKQPQRIERVLHEAICADCHKVCEVPFRPSEDRPVYCKECFAKRKPPSVGRQGAVPNKLYPVLTPVAMPSKLSKPSKQPVRNSSKKIKKKK